MGGESHTGRRRPSQDKPRLFRRQPTFWSAQANFLQRWKQIGLTIKETFQKAISLCQFKRTPVGKQAWRIHSARYCRRYKRLELHHNKGRGKGVEGCNSSHTQQSKCDWLSMTKETKQNKTTEKKLFLIGEAVVFSFFFHLKPTPSIVFFSHPSNFLMLSLPLPSPPPPPLSALLSFSVSLFPSLPLPPPCFFIKTIHCALLRPPSWNGKTNIAADRWNEGGRGQRKRAGGEERGG